MSAATRLVLFGLLLVVVFAVAYVAGDLLVPDRVVTTWNDAARAAG